MRILLMQLILPIICYFIGVFVGKRCAGKSKPILPEEDDSIQHVEYTQDQLGYDK